MIKRLQNNFSLTAEDSFPAPKWYFQQMLWVQNPRHPETLLQTITGVAYARPLDRSALERSQEIVRRHQPLRSVFRIMEAASSRSYSPPPLRCRLWI